MLDVRPNTKAAYDLFHRGSVALAQVEHNGIRIDLEYLERAKRQTTKKIRDIETYLNNDAIMNTWRAQTKDRFSLGSREQLIKALKAHKITIPEKQTNKGHQAADEDVLSKIDHPFVRRYLTHAKLQKVLNTYLVGIEREVDDRGFLHPSFTLHVTRTFRSSSVAPNFQNMPIRDAFIGKLIRSAMIPRAHDQHIVEIDYSGIEVKIAACYHKDPVMMRYLKDPTTDMHRDTAAELFLCDADNVTKPVRHIAKNRFVFPEFYGSYYAQCAPFIWDALSDSSNPPTLSDEIPVIDHLAKHGIRELGDRNNKDHAKDTYLRHVQDVERRFWKDRFCVYDQWKRDWFAAYERTGEFHSLTGFSFSGSMSRNDVINYPVQSAAFHCLLYSLICIQHELNRRGMRSAIIGQIHDSIVADVPADELKTFLRLCRYVMVDQLTKRWKWICVPIDIEMEVAPMGKPWSAKTLYELPL